MPPCWDVGTGWYLPDGTYIGFTPVIMQISMLRHMCVGQNFLNLSSCHERQQDEKLAEASLLITILSWPKQNGAYGNFQFFL